MTLFSRIYRAFCYASFTLSPRQLARLSRYRDLSSSQLSTDRQGRLVISGTEVEVESADRMFLLKGITLLDELRRCSGAKLEVDDRNRVVMVVHGVRLLLKCWEELFIAHEVFYRKLYNIIRRRPFEVLDVGLNTGTSALFFASMEYCQRVEGYELFKPTLKHAFENLALNPDLSHKIAVHAYGLGPTDEQLVLDYFPEYKGSVGKNGLPQYASPGESELIKQKESVEVRAVAPILQNFIAQAGSRDVICKIDCEGAEYDIISSLSKTDLLNKVSVFLIEWHLLGPEPIKETLMKAGFDLLSVDESSTNHGMLYAFRNSNHT